jgi:hypothetical protein
MITFRIKKMSFSTMRFLRSAAIGALLPVSLLHAQATRVASVDNVSAPQPVHAARANVPIRIDGKLAEPIWHALRPTTAFVQSEPVDGGAPTHLTEVRMVITDDAVVIGARLHDDHDALFKTSGSAAVNGVGYLSDFFEVQIDPHRDHVIAYALAVSPSGDRRSSLMTKSGVRDDSWQVHWDAATATDDDGWTVEIRIPLSEFHVKPGDEAWGVQFVRFSAARQETDVYNYVPPRGVANGQNESKQQR